MAEKLIQTRIVNKHDTYENWKSSSLVLKAGEIALASIPTEVRDNDGVITIRPTYLMKVGDGEKTFSQLNWLSATASDVYSWAKVATAEQVVVKAEGETAGKALNLWFKELVAKDAAQQVEIAALQTAIGGSSVTEAIKAAIEALDVADEAVNAQFVTAVAEADGKISVSRRALSAEDIPALGIDKITGLQAALDLKANIADVNATVNELDVKIAANAGAIETEKGRAEEAEEALGERIDGVITDYKAYADQAELDAIAAAKSYTDGREAAIKTAYEAYTDQAEVDANKYADQKKVEVVSLVEAEAATRANADKALDDRVKAVEDWKDTISNVMDFVGAVEALPESVEGYQKGDVIVVTTSGKEYVNDGVKWNEFGVGSANEAAIADLQGRMDTAEGEISTLKTGVANNLVSIGQNTTNIGAINTSLAEGGEVNNLIKAAKKAGTDAQAEVDALEQVVAALDSTVTANKTAAENAVKAEKEARESADSAINVTLGSHTESIAKNAGDIETQGEAIDALEAEFADGGKVKALQDQMAVVQGSGNGSIAKALADAKAYTDSLANGQVNTNKVAIAALDQRIDKYDGFFGLGSDSNGEFPVLVFDCGGAE